MPLQFTVAVICREMRWNYQQYQEQPIWLIDMIRKMLQTEADYERKQMKKDGGK
jgi:hypothetical protein